MKKILIFATLLSCHFYSLHAAQAAASLTAQPDSLDEKDQQAIKEIEALEKDLRTLETSRARCAMHIKRLGIEKYKTKLNILSDQLETAKLNSMKHLTGLAFDLIEHDRLVPLEKFFAMMKSAHMLDQGAPIMCPWDSNRFALLPFAAYTVYLNQENCLPILRVLENHGVDLTKPVVISGEKKDSRVELTNALEIAQTRNPAVFKFLSSTSKQWSLEEAKKAI
jgi:hypothetical protein